jgi:endoglucanase
MKEYFMKISMRKAGVLFILIITAITLITGCSKNDNQTKETAKNVEDSNTVTQSEEEKETTEQISEEKEGAKEVDNQGESKNIVVPEVNIKSYEVPQNDAMKFVADMKIGWNLGNTFDAFNDSANFTDELQYESSWCGVKTTKEMITKLKDAGFQTIRIPVSWHNHLVDKDFTISETWLNRVQEVVDYAYDQDMYVIINIHHDIAEDYYYPDNKHLDNSTKYVKTIWNQLADRFEKYGEKLIFESVNEPRLVGTDNEWWLDVNKDNCKEAVECINQLNQTFVDTVRATGGNNSSRYLMVPGYDASADGALTDLYSVPKDLKENEHKIIVSVHAYTPYNFALQAPEESGNTSEFHADSAISQKDINNFMDGLYNKYISQGIPVVIGEFGARDKNNNLQDRVDYAAFYIASARARGMIACWWDNNAFTGTGENFGILDRKSLSFAYPDMVDALMKYAENK